MTNEWLAAIEHVVGRIITAEARVIGFVAPEANSGVTALSLAATDSLRRRGANVLYMDFAGTIAAKLASVRGPAGNVQHWREPDLGETNVVRPMVTAGNRGMFDNIPWLRKEFASRQKIYSNIVVDLPALLIRNSDQLNSISIAAACDAVVLVCVRGRTSTRQIERARELMDTAGIKLVGTVLNELDYIPPAHEMAQAARRILRPTGRFGRRVAERIGNVEILR